MAKILLILLLTLQICLFADTSLAASAKDLLMVGGGTNSAEAATDVDIKDNFLQTIQVYLLYAYGIVAVGSFIFIGFKLFAAQGDEGEFKKAWIALVYIIIGLAVAPLAYVVVRIVSGFTIV